MWLVLGLPPARSDEGAGKVLALVEQHGGNVIRDPTRPGKPVVKVDLAGKDKVTDDVAKQLVILNTLTELDLGGTSVTDAGLKELSKLTNLTDLSLYGTRVT